jgi:hypothetical protein
MEALIKVGDKIKINGFLNEDGLDADIDAVITCIVEDELQMPSGWVLAVDQRLLDKGVTVTIRKSIPNCRESSCAN